MVSGKTVLTVVLVISLILNLFLILRTSGLSSEKDNYAKMGEQAVLLVKASGIGCRAEASEPLAMEKCLKSMNTKYATEPFEEKGYKNYDEKNEEQGYLIVQNRAMREFESSSFTLLWNKNQVAEGCHIIGNITRGETCKMFFPNLCEKGDLLEVQYKGKRVYLKNC